MNITGLSDPGVRGVHEASKMDIAQKEVRFLQHQRDFRVMNEIFQKDFVSGQRGMHWN